MCFFFLLYWATTRKYVWIFLSSIFGFPQSERRKIEKKQTFLGYKGLHIYLYLLFFFWFVACFLKIPIMDWVNSYHHFFLTSVLSYVFFVFPVYIAVFFFNDFIQINIQKKHFYIVRLIYKKLANIFCIIFLYSLYFQVARLWFLTYLKRGPDLFFMTKRCFLVVFFFSDSKEKGKKITFKRLFVSVGLNHKKKFSSLRYLKPIFNYFGCFTTVFLVSSTLEFKKFCILISFKKKTSSSSHFITLIFLNHLEIYICHFLKEGVD